MLRIEELPSLKNIADVILKEGRAGQLILFSFPTEDVWEKWQEFFLESLRIRLNERGEEPFWDVFSADNNSLTPEHDIAEFLGLPPSSGQMGILTACGSDPPLIIELLCDGSISPKWQSFIKETARFFRVYDSSFTSRLICLFLISPGIFPPEQANAGMRCYAFWNPLHWEEIRLIASDLVNEKENVLSRAWQISTYAGAANADPAVIAILSKNIPRSLDEVSDNIRSIRKEKKRVLGNVKIDEKRFFDEKQWDIPTGMREDWLEGALWGYTLDRSTVIPWDYVADKDFNRMLKRTIWREQVAGLYPLLMEITSLTSKIITRAKGSQWESLLQAGDNDMSITEPGAIISIFKDNVNLGQLPERISRLLYQLRFVRNKLAHLEPIDLKDVQKIWSLFIKITK